MARVVNQDRVEIESISGAGNVNPFLTPTPVDATVGEGQSTVRGQCPQQCLSVTHYKHL